MGIRDIKRKARRDLHGHMQVPALYIPTPSATPVPCTVRVWTKWGLAGALPGKGDQWAEMQETTPKIIFMVDEVPRPRAQGVVSIERGEAYIIDNAEVQDGLTITAVVTPMPASDGRLATLPLPETTDA